MESLPREITKIIKEYNSDPLRNVRDEFNLSVREATFIQQDYSQRAIAIVKQNGRVRIWVNIGEPVREFSIASRRYIRI